MEMQNVTDLTIPEGNVRTIHDSTSRLIWGRLNYDTKYAGDTVQNGTPTPDAPIPVQVATGTQTVTLGDGVDSEAFPISLGSLELCKLGVSQDYIYKSGNDWYVHKDIGMITADGSYGGYNGTRNWFYVNPTSYGKPSAIKTVVPMSNYFTGYEYTPFRTNLTVDGCSVDSSDSSPSVLIRNNTFSTATAYTTWLASTQPKLYYGLATPTDTQITDATLIGQLNAVHEWLTRYGYSSTVTGNLPIIIEQTNL